ncbi:NUDIX domain-containing protein [Hamadaea tsunoensis]|uniref:NUDIX domain-containing protein n=1 Tax=Hamadaea tsunoensis TaxID=53368 RepID=UPI00040AE5C3|nr:NUDIX domain-containing protein [Hamadaea tsunoensis]
MVARIALIMLVDDDGRILVQMHDVQAATHPNRWSLPGGLVAAGETPAAAARRYAQEQADVPIQGDVEEVWAGFVPGHRVPTFAFWARTTAGPADVAAEVGLSATDKIIPRPGVRTRFLSGPDLLTGRAYTLAAGYVLSRFADSPLYERITEQLRLERLTRLT